MNVVNDLYYVKENQTPPTYSSLNFFISLSLQFSNIKKSSLVFLLFSVSPINIKNLHLQNCLFVLRLNVPVNNFSVMSGRSHRFLGN